MALQLNHVHLKTPDPEKTAKFYVDTLGATIVGKAGTNGYRLDLHGLALNVTTFLESQTRAQKYGMEHIAIDTDELDTLVEQLKAQGINILEQTTAIPGGRPNPVTTPTSQLAFRKHPCDNTPLIGTF